ncbi:hypothetical protein MAMP_01446 [Methylophaga aminisulfidivorans MP]|uniref:Uncharacterized protein n=1 Tax=Methylophaga aminisulfidivorans MP TaxID=1026882 RepID=F5SZB2_9GAMM|nr:hypothetical protein MAMP_01446 [Methylophaga aminisulfidivorans MP]
MPCGSDINVNVRRLTQNNITSQQLMLNWILFIKSDLDDK